MKLLRWLPRVAFAALPLIGSKLQRVPEVWPPLGSLETYAAFIASALIAASGFIPGLIKTKTSAKRHAIIALVVAFILLIPYGYLLATRVVGVEIGENAKLYRTVGTERTELARQKFDSLPDEEVLRGAGLDDASIKRMWTPRSVNAARIELFVSYLLAMMSINYALGAFARATSQPPPK